MDTITVRAMSNFTVRSVDDTFGPFLRPSGNKDFDFTLLFEDTILSILPSVLLLVLAPIRVFQLWQASRKVAATRLRDIKIGLLVIFSLLQAVNLVIWCLQVRVQTRASIAAASLSLGAALAICVLSYLEHTRSVRPSSLLNVYLLFTVFMDAAKVRTLWLRGNANLLAGVSSGIVAVKLMVLIVEAHEKRKILLSPYVDASPETTSGLYSRSLFWWLNPMFLLGYKSIIRELDLFPTDDELTSATLRKRFVKQWAKRKAPVRRYELILAMARIMATPFMVGMFPRLCYTFFRFMQPLLIKRVTTFISQSDSDNSDSVGWALTAAYGLVYLGIAISAARYNHLALKMTAMVRGTLVTAVYDKTMDLSIAALDENSAVTLMSTDVQRICDALQHIHEVWACPLDIGIGIWLLYSEIGPAMLGALLVSFLAIAGTFAISARTSLAQKEWMASIQTRVNTTAKALQSMKGVKMLGLNDMLCNIVSQLRITEIRQSLSTRRLYAFSLLTGNITDTYAPGVTFTIFVVVALYNGQTLQVSSAYTALSLIYLLGAPPGVLAFTIPPLMAAVGCFDRVQDYLLLESRKDHRLLTEQSSNATVSASNALAASGPVMDPNAIELKQLNRTSRPETSPGRVSTIRVNNLTISWSPDDHPVIDDVSFEILPGITMLVGPVGCGKSSLLKGLLGEVPSSKGHVYTNELQAAFVGQDPWIQNGTIRENVVGISNFEPEIYAVVIQACALDQDLVIMKHGDRTRVGSSGAGLSGGQKLRVALARAVYSRRRIIILDDVFSGLDAGSEDRIFSLLLGKNGLLRNKTTAVLLATHAAHRLSYADHIIALSSTGSIVDQGSFADLMKTSNYISSLSARHTAEVDDQQGEPPMIVKAGGLDDIAQVNAAEDLARATGDLAVYKYYFSAIGYGRTALMFVLMMLYAVFSLLPDLWFKFWTSAVATHGNSVNGMYLGILLMLESIGCVALTWVSFHAYTGMVPLSARHLHGRLLGTIRNAPLSFFTSTDIGQVINRFSQDMNVVDSELPSALFEFTASVSIGLMQAILICLSAAYFAAIMPVVLGLMYLIQKFYLRTSRQIRLMDLEAKAPLYSHFIESLTGLTTIRAFGWASNFEQRNIELLDRSQRPFYLLFCIQRWLNLVLDLTVMGLAVLLMILIVILRTKMDAGLVGLALLSIMNFNLSLTMIVRQYTSLETSLGAIARIKTFVQQTRLEHLPEESNSVPESWPSQGSVVFTKLSASYTHDGSPVLKNVNIAIPPGQKIGIVGCSGSGKSSFITTLFHMLEIQAGTLQIDNIDICTIPREQLRQRLNVIPQDSLFIAGTIRLNLDPLAVASSDTSLESILSKVGLWSIVSSAGGLDAAMDPENLLSHGQRQLFCLARAIVNKKKSKILILDEATASVDIQTDELMQRIIREEFCDCTIIAVAHRLGTIRDFDRVVVLDHGVVVEDGAPEDLLLDAQSWFRRLWDS